MLSEEALAGPRRWIPPLPGRGGHSLSLGSVYYQLQTLILAANIYLVTTARQFTCLHLELPLIELIANLNFISLIVKTKGRAIVVNTNIPRYKP